VIFHSAESLQGITKAIQLKEVKDPLAAQLFEDNSKQQPHALLVQEHMKPTAAVVHTAASVLLLPTHPHLGEIRTKSARVISPIFNAHRKKIAAKTTPITRMVKKRATDEDNKNIFQKLKRPRSYVRMTLSLHHRTMSLASFRTLLHQVDLLSAGVYFLWCTVAKRRDRRPEQEARRTVSPPSLLCRSP